MILSAGLVQMLLRNPKKQMRNSQSLCVARNSSIYILTSGYIHSSGFVLSHFKRNVKNAWCKLKYGKDQMKKNQTSKTKELLFCPPPNKLPFKKLRGIFWNFFLIFLHLLKMPAGNLKRSVEILFPSNYTRRNCLSWCLHLNSRKDLQ